MVTETGLGLRGLWPVHTALPCVNYTYKAYYIKRGHLLAGEMSPAPACNEETQVSLLSAKDMIALQSHFHTAH